MGRSVKSFQLSAADQAALLALITKGHHPVRRVTRGRVLLRLAEGVSGYVIARELDLHVQTVYRLRQRYEQSGLAAALDERPRCGGPRRFDGAVRAQLTALACSPAPEGHSRWTLRLLADKAVELQVVESISHETVGQVLKKTNYSPTASNTGAWGR